MLDHKTHETGSGAPSSGGHARGVTDSGGPSRKHWTTSTDADLFFVKGPSN